MFRSALYFLLLPPLRPLKSRGMMLQTRMPITR